MANLVPATVESVPEYTRKQVAEHTDMSSKVLVIIDNLVYDVTNLVLEHPGGQDVIIEFAGRDATSAFEGVGHSKAARKWKDELLIGRLCAADRA